jgi:hypothetical protein
MKNNRRLINIVDITILHTSDAVFARKRKAEMGICLFDGRQGDGGF